MKCPRNLSVNQSLARFSSVNQRIVNESYRAFWQLAQVLRDDKSEERRKSDNEERKHLGR